MKTVVFVCTVNRWRSPMAEFLFRNLLKRRNDNLEKQIVVSSAGIVPEEEKEALVKKGLDLPDPLFGYRPLACVMLYLMKRGIDSHMHRSRELTQQIMENSDLIIPVVDKHKDAVIKTFPSEKDKVFSLEELSRPFRLPEITNEPPGLMPPDKFCMLECDHWEFTDQAMSMIEERLKEATDTIIDLLGL